MLFLLLLVAAVTGQQGIPKEYCHDESFRPSCGADSVIMMQSAVYGLMKTGKCLTSGFGHIGCQSNQLAFLDSRCSGLNQCEVAVVSRDLKDNTEDCPKELTSYLEASYTCQRVFAPPTPQCTAPYTLPGSGSAVHLASSVARTTNCGLSEAPFIVDAEPGQQINVTLYDFAWSYVNRFQDRCPYTYGHILSSDTEDVIDICGGTSQRIKHVHHSTAHQIHIVLDNQAVQDRQFIIKYEILGCRDIVPPRNAWLKKDKDKVTVGCQTNSQEWEMKCVGKRWIGSPGNCSVTAAVNSSPDKEKTGFHEDHVLSVAIGSAALVVCCITVTIGVYVVKRHQYKSQYNGKGPYMVPVPLKGGPGNGTLYNVIRAPEGTVVKSRTGVRPGRASTADLSNSVPTGYSFQRPGTSGSGASAMGGVPIQHIPSGSNLATVQIHAVPMSRQQRPPPPNRAAQPTTRTLTYNNANNNPAHIAASSAPNPAAATRTLPPPPPALREEPPSAHSKQAFAPLPPPNETRPLLMNNSRVNRENTFDSYPSSEGYNTDTYSSDMYNTGTGPPPRGVSLLAGRGRAVTSPPPPSLASSGEREDDDSVKYYVLEAPQHIPPISDTEE